MKTSYLIACCIISVLSNQGHTLEKSYQPTEKAFVGPVLGNTTPNHICIWFYTEPKRKVEIHYGEEKNKGSAKATFKETDEITSSSHKGKGQPYKVTLPNLKAYTTYYYRVTIDGKSSDALVGKFRTAPEQHKPRKFKIAISSCVNGNNHEAWDVLRENDPDFHLMLGDTAYVDRTDPQRIWDRHLKVRRFKEIAKTFKNIPHFTVWDDHDYGANNANGSLKGKEKSLASWKQLWCNPTMGLKDTPGVFYKFSWADVDFFVLDGRYYRSNPRAPDDEKKTMLGEKQFNWLVKSLKESRAKFKVLATGSTWISKDSWKPFPGARKRLLEAIQTNKISGIIYLSGDLHRCAITAHQKRLIHPIGYPFVELTSSGIGNTKSKDGLRNFILIDFDTTVSDPTLTATILGALPSGEKVVGQKRMWKLSQLTAK